MGKPNKICIKCGVPYEICYVCDTTTRFSWREVACSVECYTAFLDESNGNLDAIKEKLDEPRNEEPTIKKSKKVVEETE